MARKATWQRHVDSCERLRGAEVALMRGRATRIYADAWVAPCGKIVFGLASDGPTSIVGPRKIVGAVTQMR